MKRKNLNKPNATGRNPGARHVRIYHDVLRSEAYRSLSLEARAVLNELLMIYNGENNGSLYLGVRDAADRIGASDTRPAIRAFAELQEAGFIVMTKDAHFDVKTGLASRARCWRITFLHGPGKRAATMDFRVKIPLPGSAAHRRMERGLRALKAHSKGLSQNKFTAVDSTTPGHIAD